MIIDIDLSVSGAVSVVGQGHRCKTDWSPGNHEFAMDRMHLHQLRLSLNLRRIMDRSSRLPAVFCLSTNQPSGRSSYSSRRFDGRYRELMESSTGATGWSITISGYGTHGASPLCFFFAFELECHYGRGWHGAMGRVV